MIAAPMTTRNSLSYRELAKAEARMKRVVASDDLVRLKQETVAVGATHVEFIFGYTQHGQPKVHASLTSEATIACQWCLQPKGVALSSEFEAVLAADENEASQWSEDLQAGVASTEVIVAGKNFDAVRLIEDELLLSLPNQVCGDKNCPDRPGSQYGTEEGSESGHDANPFAALEVLKDDFVDERR